MQTARIALVALLTLSAAAVTVACDDKAKDTAGTPSATVSAMTSAPTAMPSASAAPSAGTNPSASASANAFASAGASLVTGDAKDVIITMKDPTKELEKSVKAAAGGSVTLFLPDYPGTVWSIDANDKTIGKAKEEVIPGFAPGTNGHQFKWSLAGPLFKAGDKHKITFVNKKAGDKDKAAKPQGTFALTIEIS